MAQVSSVDLVWRKARASNANGCVELAALPDGGVAVRDSKDLDGTVLTFTRREWLAFVDGMSRGEFAHLT